MKTDALQIRGKAHEINCEDAFYLTSIGNEWVIAAVMDGCSSGIESVFASNLLVKIVRKSCNALPFIDQKVTSKTSLELKPKQLGQHIITHVFDDLKKVKSLLSLNKLELLSTLVLLVYNKHSKQAYIFVSGDGYFQVNDEFIAIDQKNQPDYMAYHFKESIDELTGYSVCEYEFDKVEYVGIASDGIAQYLHKNGRKSTKIKPAEYILNRNGLSLKEKEDQLNNYFKLIPFDDVCVISIDA